MNTASAAATERAMTRRAGLPLTGLRLPPRRTAESGNERRLGAVRFLDPVGRLTIGRDTDPVEGQQAQAGERSGQLGLGVELVRVLPAADDLLDGRASLPEAAVEGRALLGAIAHHTVVAAPPELDGRAAAGDRGSLLQRAASCIGARIA